MVREFYQIYRDADSFVKLFEIDRGSITGIEPSTVVARIIGTTLRTLKDIKEFYGGQKQYKIYLNDGTEVKLSNPFGCGFSRCFIQVSADSHEKAKEVFSSVLQSVKAEFEKKDERDA